MRSSWSSKGRPAYGASEIDRCCPLGTGIDPSSGTRMAPPGHRRTKAIGGAGWRERWLKLGAGPWDSAPAAAPDDRSKPDLCRRAAGPEPPTTAPTGPIGARILYRLHVTAARDIPVRILAAEWFSICQPPVDHRQVIWGSAAWAQPSRQAGGLGLRGWTAEPPTQRRHCVSLTGPPETAGGGIRTPTVTVRARPAPSETRSSAGGIGRGRRLLGYPPSGLVQGRP
jgi:hypothetical protein